VEVAHSHLMREHLGTTPFGDLRHGGPATRVAPVRHQSRLFRDPGSEGTFTPQVVVLVLPERGTAEHLDKSLHTSVPVIIRLDTSTVDGVTLSGHLPVHVEWVEGATVTFTLGNRPHLDQV